MCFRVTRIELDGAAVVNQSLGIFSLVKTRVSFSQKFLGVPIAARAENQKQEKQCTWDSSGESHAAREKSELENTGFHNRLEKQFCTPSPRLASIILSQC